MSRKNQNARIQFKYSTIGGTQPSIAPSMDHTDGTWSPTDLYVGEFFLNAVDDTMWVRTLTGIIPLTSGTTYVDISTFVNKTGDTMTGELVVPTMSATTSISTPQIYADTFTGGVYYGDGSNLTGLPYTTFTGGTVNGDTTFTAGVDFTSASVSANTIDTAGGLNFIGGDVSVNNNLDVTGAVSATTYYGDGSNLTGLNISGFTGYWEVDTTNQNSITTNFNSNTFLTTEYGFIVGRINTLKGADYSAILGGVSNNIENATSSMIMASSSNITSNANYGVVLGGTANNMETVDYGFILGGNQNTNAGQNYSGIIGGRQNNIEGATSSGVILGGTNNSLGGLVNSYNTIIGGYNNNISGTTSVVGNSIIGGNGNTIEGDLDNIIILGGVGVTATQEDTTYVDNLNINTLGGGASVNNLGIDTNGNVVVGSGGGGSSLWTQSGSSIYYNTGSVGIGTTTPNSVLEVSGSTGKLEVRLDNDNSNNTNQLLLTSDENTYTNFMSIGTPTTSAELQFGMVGPSSTSKVVGLTDDSFILATSAADNMNFINNEGTGTSDNIAFYAGKAIATDIDVIKPDIIILGDGTNRGNVGIATGNPTELLDVSGGNIQTDGQIIVGNLIGNTFSTNNFEFDGDNGMIQEVDGQGMSSNGTITFTNEKEGSTYTIIFIQGSGTYDVDLGTGYWLNDTAPFDFSTLADNERAMITATRLNSVWYFAVKELTFVA